MTVPHLDSPTGRLALLLSLLEQDPANPALLADAAETALTERAPQTAYDLLARCRAIAPLTDHETNLAALAALQLGRHEEAAAGFEQLVDSGVVDAAVRFNLAWVRTLLGEEERALALIDEEMAATLPQAAALHLQLLHAQNELDAALELARRYLSQHPGHASLNATVSVLAIDLEELTLARECALRAGDHADALATLGTLALGERDAAEAIGMFDRALARSPNVPRAWVGRGLARLVSGDAAGAASEIDRGAGMFKDHLGSWIAAGWAHFIKGDRGAARQRFEMALALDSTFAETHGSLAVLAVLDGDLPGGRAGVERALRLDRTSASAALAGILLAAGGGDTETGRRLFEQALNAPMGSNGETLAQALTRLGLGR